MLSVQINKRKVIDLDSIIYAEIIEEGSLKILFNNGELLMITEGNLINKLWKVIQSRALSFDEYANEFGVDFS